MISFHMLLKNMHSSAQRACKVNNLGGPVCREDLIMARVQISMKRTGALSIIR